jgi:hypothetical protein
MTSHLVLLLWIGFAILNGIYDADAFAYRDERPNTHNPHIAFTVLRVLIAFILLLLYQIEGGTLPDILSMTIIMMLVFPFFHDGFYYLPRGMLDTPHYTFFSQSQRTDAWFSVDFASRFVLLLVGVVAYIINLLTIF